MNKYSKIIAVIFCFVWFNLNTFADEMYTFVTNVNAAWASTNYSQLLQVINDRLTQYPDDILALGTKQWYYFECEINTSNAQLAANSLLNAARQTGREDIIPLAEDATRLILDMPPNATGTYTQAQIELNHQGGGRIFLLELLNHYLLHVVYSSRQRITRHSRLILCLPMEYLSTFRMQMILSVVQQILLL